MSKPVDDIPDQEEIDRVLAMAQRIHGGPDVAIYALVRMLPILYAVAFDDGETALADWQRISRAVEQLIRQAYAMETKQ